MKLVKLVLATVVAASATTAMAETTHWYAGLGGGQTKVSDWVSKSDALGLMEEGGAAVGLESFDGTASASTDDSGSAWKVFGGVQFHPNFAIELAYLDLGEVTAKGHASGDFCDSFS